jgi:Flp pilus assembly protein TadB
VILFSALFLLVFWGSGSILRHFFPSKLDLRIHAFTSQSVVRANTPQHLIKKLPGKKQNKFYKSKLSDLGLFFLNRSRQSQILRDLPDALDLLCICLEAGQSMDAALLRVADELDRSKSPLGSEIKQLSLSLRAGLGKETALKEFASRVGGDEVHALVSLLIQAERYGTSIALSLKVQSDMMRERRKQKVEEQASKMGLKMLIPLVLCHLPALFIVLLGPACIELYRTFSPLWSGATGQ